MESISNELIGGLPSPEQLATLTIRLVLAMILGSVIGIQRERSGKPAGVRTHILVALGSTSLVIAPMEFGMDSEGLSRVIQGLVTGIGFLGAGAILKLEEKREVEGLTTAAGIWMTAAIGLALGLGRLGLALVSTALTWITLALIGKFEAKINAEKPRAADRKP